MTLWVSEGGKVNKLSIQLIMLTASFYSTGFCGPIWFGDPDKGRNVFNNLNFEAGSTSTATGTITPAIDPIYGKIWRVFKPKPDKRAEIRGATGFSNHGGTGGVIKLDETYYLGWRWKAAMPVRSGGFASFQWKAYGNHTQNYPFTMGYNGQTMTMTKFKPNWADDRANRIIDLWSKSVPLDKWITLVVVVKMSWDETVGFIELYYNGEKQEFKTGGTRSYHKTMDGLEVAPKWGVYGGGIIGTEVTVDLADMRIATDLESAMPGRGISSSISLLQTQSRWKRSFQEGSISRGYISELAGMESPGIYNLKGQAIRLKKESQYRFH